MGKGITENITLRTINYFIDAHSTQRNLNSFVIWFAEYQGVTTFPTVMPIRHGGHEDPSTTLFRWALSSQAMDLPVFIHLNKANIHSILMASTKYRLAKNIIITVAHQLRSHKVQIEENYIIINKKINKTQKQEST